MKHSSRIIALFITFAIVSSFATVPAYAAGDVDIDISLIDLDGAGDFLKWMVQGTQGGVNQMKNTVRHIWDYDVCTKSPNSDGRHNFVERHTQINGQVGDWYVCEYCGKSGGEALKDGYQEHVEELPVNGIDNQGSYIWYPSVMDISESDSCSFAFFDSIRSLKFSRSGENFLDSDPDPYFITEFSNGVRAVNFSVRGHSGGYYVVDSYSHHIKPDISLYFVVPVSGIYQLGHSVDCDISCFSGSGYIEHSFEYSTDNFTSQGGSYASGSSVRVRQSYDSSDYIDSVRAISGRIYMPYFSVTPDVSALTGHENDYTPDSRPAAYVGDYQIIGNNGELFVDNSTIISEDNNSVYNPVTGDTTTYDSWAYDYSSRTYTFDNSAGDTTTVTYGDENITIKEGDTVYNINYYIAPNGGGDDPTPTPTPEPDHKHNYTSSITREATCTTAGVETFSCECGESYTKPVPSLGHDWTIKEQVPTAYDNGEETTKGYTVYRCTRCGEEYKSTDGTVPDSGGGGSGSVWSKIGELLGSIFGGFFKLIGQFLSAILDVLISLAQEITDKLSTIVEMILGWFDELPKLFTGFMAFLTAIFGFLPEEMLMLLEFGLAAVLFIGILKAIRRGR